ncbi:hypothetical protein HYZ78_02340 [Candidatus Microgenomates bacterium]|nr:hypothetical protein [Candidatus Microgenomates bacterium]
MKKHHFTHFLVLFGMFGLSILGFLTFPYDKVFQRSLVVAAAAGYFAWGIIHHWVHKDLYFEVVLEYLAIAVVGSIITLVVLQ